ncbi:MAG: AAA family ATPase [Calditrichales bacterium]|nr:AAA family ATPase [Calditrichales bacterium]
MLNRMINLPQQTSFFLFGPRQTGKSTLIKATYNRDIWEVNLLLSENYHAYKKDPSLFRKQAQVKIEKEKIKTVFIDEIQRIPELLNEIHYLIENYPHSRFILTGSNARKLRRGGTNLLAGRAIEANLYPFVYDEIKDIFSLEEILTYGTLPPLLNKTADVKKDILKTYVNTYLKEEIQAEGLARNVGGFYRFLDIAAHQFSELLNFTSVARDCALPTRTVQTYYEILEDTLIGYRLLPWRKSIRKRLTSHPKFYFFDCGVVNALNNTIIDPIPGILKGKLFEQFIISETIALIKYKKSDARIYYWRTNHGAEVDLLIEKYGKIEAAIEIKSAKTISGGHLSGLRAFREENSATPLYLISFAEHAYQLYDVNILPWQRYSELLDTLL